MSEEFGDLSSKKRIRITDHKPGYYEEDVKEFIKNETEFIDELRVFLVEDMFYFVKQEMTDEQDLIEYLNNHFSILEGQRNKLAGSDLT